MGESGWDKLALVKAFLSDRLESGTLRSTDIVLFLDGYDTFVNRRLEVILERFLDFKCHALFAAEKWCWPKRNSTRQWPEVGTEYRYLNSGAYIAHAGALREMLSCWDPERSKDDQQFFIDIYLSGVPGVRHLDMRIDHECVIFQCLNGVSPGELVTTRFGDLNNVRTGSHPCVVHGNGPVKAAFADLAAELGYRPRIAKAIDCLRRRRSSADPSCDLQIRYLANPGAESQVYGPEMLLVEFMPPQACADLIEFAEERGGWAPMPEDRFPAQEIRLRDLSARLLRELEEAWMSIVAPIVERYWAPVRMYGLRDAFLIKYTPQTQKALALHNDASLVTGCVKLNDAYEGGELVWPRQQVTNVGVPVGKLILFPGQVTHGHHAAEVKSGTKYSLTIWTSRFKGDVNRSG